MRVPFFLVRAYIVVIGFRIKYYISPLKARSRMAGSKAADSGGGTGLHASGSASCDNAVRWTKEAVIANGISEREEL